MIAIHHMKTEGVLCASFLTPKSDCRMCVDPCPAEAIHLSDNGPDINDLCIDCGVCLSVCPNGAFRIEERDDETIIGEIGEIIETTGDKTFRISCSSGDASSDLILPCLSRLTETLLLEPIKMGASSIELLQPSCSECPLSKASTHLDRVLRHACDLYEMIGVEKNRLQKKEIPLKQRSAIPEKSMLRRHFLRAIGVRAMEGAVKTLPDMRHESNDEKGTFRDALRCRPENLKRSSLLRTLKAFPSVKEVVVPSKEALSAAIEVSHKCTGCGACAALCPAGAIIQKETEDHFHLEFRAGVCTNCRVCVKACVYGALRIKKEVLLNHLFNETAVRLFEANKKICPVCKIPFLGTEMEFCPLCMDRLKKQNTIVEKLKEVAME